MQNDFRGLISRLCAHFYFFHFERAFTVNIEHCAKRRQRGNLDRFREIVFNVDGDRESIHVIGFAANASALQEQREGSLAEWVAQPEQQESRAE